MFAVLKIKTCVIQPSTTNSWSVIEFAHVSLRSLNFILVFNKTMFSKISQIIPPAKHVITPTNIIIPKSFVKTQEINTDMINRTIPIMMCPKL